MRVEGAGALHLAEDASLEVTTAVGPVRFSAPQAWQEQGAVREAVDVAYALAGRDYGFELGPHDPNRPVFIDPILSATYLGGRADDRGLQVAVHPTSGEVYVAGITWSPDFPQTEGGARDSHADCRPPACDPNDPGNPTNPFRSDVFIARLDPALDQIAQATYYGGVFNQQTGSGTGDDDVAGLAFHPETGDVYITGFTTSVGLPGRFEGALSEWQGAIDGYAAWFSADLTELRAATYLGGISDDVPTGIAFHPDPTGLPVDPKYDFYVVGRTRSANLFGVSPTSYQTMPGGGWDAFVTRVSQDLAFVRSTYLGGADDDQGWGVFARDSGGPVFRDVYVTGDTRSEDFPGTDGGAQPAKDSELDAFVAVFDRDLDDLIQATHVGGKGEDSGQAVAFHPDSALDALYIAGTTGSSDLPWKRAGAYSTHGGGVRDAFVTRLPADLTGDGVRVSTYLGGEDQDRAVAIAVDETSGEVYVTGDTLSTGFRGTTDGAQSSNLGDSDAFAARLDPTLEELEQATYLGGHSLELGYDIALHPTTGDVYVAGLTWSKDPRLFEYALENAPSAQPDHGGGNQDAFVVRLDATLGGLGTFEVTKGAVKLTGGGWKLKAKGGLSTGATPYTGDGSDLRVFVEDVEYIPFGSRILKTKRTKFILRDAAIRANKFVFDAKRRTFKLKLKEIPEANLTTGDGVDFAVELLERRGELTAGVDPIKGKKLVPARTDLVPAAP